VGAWKEHPDCPQPEDDPDDERRHAEAEDSDTAAADRPAPKAVRDTGDASMPVSALPA
jgi:hypothetical protein